MHRKAIIAGIAEGKLGHQSHSLFDYVRQSCMFQRCSAGDLLRCIHFTDVLLQSYWIYRSCTGQFVMLNSVLVELALMQAT